MIFKNNYRDINAVFDRYKAIYRCATTMDQEVVYRRLCNKINVVHLIDDGKKSPRTYFAPLDFPNCHTLIININKSIPNITLRMTVEFYQKFRKQFDEYKNINITLFYNFD